MQTPQRKLKDIQRLLSAFPAVSGEPALILHNYLMVAEDFDADIVEEAVTLYIKGAMPGFDGRFAPTAPMLATGCRKAVEDRSRVAYLAGLKMPRLPPPDLEKTPEQMARGRAMMEAAIDNLAAHDALASAEALDASKARWEKVNTMFHPDMSDDAIAERLLGRRPFDVGNDGEGFAA